MGATAVSETIRKLLALSKSDNAGESAAALAAVRRLQAKSVTTKGAAPDARAQGRADRLAGRDPRFGRGDVFSSPGVEQPIRSDRADFARAYTRGYYGTPRPSMAGVSP